MVTELHVYVVQKQELGYCNILSSNLSPRKSIRVPLHLAQFSFLVGFSSCSMTGPMPASSTVSYSILLKGVGLVGWHDVFCCQLVVVYRSNGGFVRGRPMTKKYAESRRHIHSSRASQSSSNSSYCLAGDSTLSEATPTALHMMHGLSTNATRSS